MTQQSENNVDQEIILSDEDRKITRLNSSHRH